VIDQVTEIAKDCDFSIFLGDLFHTSPVPAVVFNEVYERIEKFQRSCSLLMVAGNHDLRSQYYRGDPRDIPFLKFLNFEHVSIAEVHDSGLEHSVLAFNHRRAEDAAELIRQSEPRDILVMHQEVYGASNDAGHTFKGGLSAEELKKFKWVFNGHIHRPQILADRIVCVGACLHIDFGDSDDRGVIILDTEKDDIDVVDLKFPRFVTLQPGEEQPDNKNFYRPAQLDQKKREALKIPGWQDAISEYVAANKVPEDKVAKYTSAAEKIVTAVPREVSRPQPFTLKRVEMEGFGVFSKKVSLDVIEGLHLLVGEVGDTGRSNGSGKSTLWEAASYALYGLTSKGVKGEDVMSRPRKRGKSCTVTLRFDSARGELRVTRKQTASGSKLEAEFGDHVESGREPEVRKWIADTLGVGYDFFRQMVYYSQEKAAFFADMNDADRKQLLGTLLGLSWYEDAEEQAKTRYKASQQLVEDRTSSRREFEIRLEETVKRKRSAECDSQGWEEKKAKDLKEATDNLDARRISLRDLLATSDSLLSAVTERKQERLSDAELGLAASLKRVVSEESVELAGCRERHTKTLGDLQKKIGDTEESLASITCTLDSSASIDAMKTSRGELVESERSLTDETASLKADHIVKKKRTADLEHERRGIVELTAGARCPTCKVPVTEESRQGCLDEIDGELKKLTVSCSDLDCRLSQSVLDLRSARNKISDIDSDISAREAMERKQSEAKLGLESLKKEYELHSSRSDNDIRKIQTEHENERREIALDHEHIIAKIEKEYSAKILDVQSQFQTSRATEESSIRSSEEKISELKSAKNPHDDRLGGLLTEISDANTNLADADKLIKEAESRVEMYEFWVRGFGREGIRAALLGEFCRAFTAEVNDVLSPMRVGLSVELSPARKLKSGEVRDQMEYVIYTPTGQSSYSQLSGGEKTRVDLSSMLALNRIASRHFGIQGGLFGVLILDEDEEGCELTYQILQGFTARSIYVISHSRSMQSLFDNVLTVRREGNSSVLVQ
jgi:DNA repair exonuclease SbcCD ATPase subunit